MNDSRTPAAKRLLAAIAVTVLSLHAPPAAIGGEGGQPAVGIAVTRDGWLPPEGPASKPPAYLHQRGEAGVWRKTAASQAPRTKAVDSVAVTLRKVADELVLSWSGHNGPVTVLRSKDAGFERDVTTLEDGFDGSSLTIPLSGGAEATFYEVADSSIASRAVVNGGYDPLPPPRLLGFGLPEGGVWWGDDLLVGGRYLSPIAASNVAFIYDRPLRAGAVGGVAQGTLPGREYATNATFEIPGDTRGGVITVQVDNARSTTEEIALDLLVPDIVYSAIQGVSWAPSTGRLWVAADDKIDEIDLFHFDPTRRNVDSDLNSPRLSRVTNAGQVLFVESVLGATQVLQVDVNADPPVVTPYADTFDADFTRPVLPVGIAVTPDGSACYLADASAGRIVRIPAGNSTPIEDDWGGKTDWLFSDPCGIDAAPSGSVYVAEATGAVRRATASQTTLYASYSVPMRSIQVDREISTDGIDRFVVTNQPGIAEVFNLEEIGYGWNGVETAGTEPARHLGGAIFATSDGRIDLKNHVFYGLGAHIPERVLISNADPDTPYLSHAQTIDRVIELSLLDPWAPDSIPVRLRLIDPPDLAPYDTKELDDPAGFAAFPYEANDNQDPITDCVAAGECGLSLNADGSNPSLELDVAPPGPVYLKIPDDISGENFQIEMSKVDPATSQPIPERVLALGPVFTSWKRIFVERDKMFRRGGVLSSDYGAPGSCGEPGQPLCCGGGGTLPCDQVEVFGGHTVNAGDWIMVFDESSVHDWFAENRVVTDVGSPDPSNGLVVLTIDEPLQHSYLASTSLSDITGTFRPDFGNYHSAGVGTIYSCDLSANQINNSDSCFFEGDLRGVEKAFGDANVEVAAPKIGISLLPHLGDDWFTWANVYEPPPETPGPMDFLSWIWNYNRSGGADNWRHLIGASSSILGTTYGQANWDYHWFYVFREAIEEKGANEIPPRNPDEVHHFTQDTTGHEIAHHFWVQICNTRHHTDEEHPKNAWCEETGDCGPGASTPELCKMNTGDILAANDQGWDPVMRFCDECLSLGDPECPEPPAGEPRAGAIRTQDDPLP